MLRAGFEVQAAKLSRLDAWNVAPRWTIPVFSRLFKLSELLSLLGGGVLSLAIAGHVFGALKLGSAALTLAAIGLGGFEALRLCRCYTWERLAGEEGVLLSGAIAAVACGGSAGACLLMLGMPGWDALRWGSLVSLIEGSAIVLLRLGVTDQVRHWRRRGMFTSRVAVVGDDIAAALLQRLSAEDASMIAAVGQYTENTAEFDERSGRRGDIDSLLLECRLGRIDAVILAVSPDERARLERLSSLLEPMTQDLYTFAECADIAGPDARPAALGQQSLLLLRNRPIGDLQALSKAVFDRAAATAIFMVIAPLLAVVALLIRLESPGPVVFRQLRVGYNNRLFWIFKFRSMRNDAADALATQQTVRDDPRVTRLGAVIRKLSIDELPQLFNVLKGDMSLVGPRPHAPGTSVDGKRVHELVKGYPSRHLVKPGITGLAQVRGFRGGMHTTQQVTDRLASDLEYARRQSVWLDIKIILMTVMREARSHRAF